MSLKSFLKNNKLFSLISVLFLAWISFLIILMITVTREVVFYDYLTDTDVSSEYSSQIPLIRYIFEPIIGIAYNFTVRDYYWPVTVILIYIIIRAIYIILKKKEKIKSEKLLTLIYMVRDIMGFTIKIVILIIAGLFSYLLIAFLILGPLVFYSFMMILKMAFLAGIILLIIKTAIMIMKLYHPHLNFNYRIKREEKKPLPKALKIMKKEIVYLFGFAFIFISINLMAISWYLPTQDLNANLEENEVLMDFHSHTHFSDGWLSPEERVSWFIDQGIDIVAITDHQTTRGAVAAKRYVEQYNLPITIIIGQEYTTDYGIHLNIFGIEEDIVPIAYKVEGGPLALTTEEMIKYVKSHGGYVIVNHYNNDINDQGELGVPYTYKELMEWGVDGFEIINEGEKYPVEIKKFCLENGLVCFSDTDMHLNVELNSFMRVKLDDPNDRSLDNIFTTLKKNEHETVLIQFTPNRIEFPGFFSNYGEVENFISYLLNMGSVQSLSWIIWSSGAFLVVIYIYKRTVQANLEKLREKLL